jgi:NAD(P)-dependent dehydrogenase (short-subunit alcohol dehydrogenase family)
LNRSTNEPRPGAQRPHRRAHAAEPLRHARGRAGPMLFLASDPARLVSGVVLPVDGGYLIS